MDIPNLIGLVMGVISFLGGVVMWHKGSVEKRYAAQRDFQHLKRNYQQLTTALDHLDEGVGEGNDQLKRELTDIKASLNEVKMLLQFLMAQQSTTSQGMPMNVANPLYRQNFKDD